MALFLHNTTPIEYACNLPFLQPCELEQTPHVLQKGISIINSMIELEYIVATESGLQFTNSGINYMINKYGEFMEYYRGKDIDLDVALNFVQTRFHENKITPKMDLE